MTDRILVTDSPTDMPLPFWGKVRLKSRCPWVPCVFWADEERDEDGTHLRDVKYWAWINGETWQVPDVLKCPRWPWHPCKPDEWLRLYREWENADAQQH